MLKAMYRLNCLFAAALLVIGFSRPISAFTTSTIATVKMDNCQKNAQCFGGIQVWAIQSDTQDLAINCAQRAGRNTAAFANCMGGQVPLTENQNMLLNCVQRSNDTNSLASCAGPRLLGNKLNSDQRVALECASISNGEQHEFYACAGRRLLNSKLNPDHLEAVECMSLSGDAGDYANCVGSKIVGENMTEQERSAIECVLQSTCAESIVLYKLSNDQKIALECIMKAHGDSEIFIACEAKKRLVIGLLMSNLTLFNAPLNLQTRAVLPAALDQKYSASI